MTGPAESFYRALTDLLAPMLQVYGHGRAGDRCAGGAC